MNIRGRLTAIAFLVVGGLGRAASAAPLSENFCPNNPNTRGQMAVFLDKTFGLKLYGP